MSVDFRRVEFDPTNPEPRCPCVLLLDTSGSMTGAPIAELNAGLKTLKEELSKDELAAARVEVAIVTFGPVSLTQDFITANQFEPPTLFASGDTPTGAAIHFALDKIEERKKVYRSNGVDYFRPWVFLITDGAPNAGDAWEAAAARVHQAEAGKKVAFFAVGVENANMDILAKITPRTALRLKGLNFREMFVWLSTSLTSVSHSKLGEDVPLQTPAGWGNV